MNDQTPVEPQIIYLDDYDEPPQPFWTRRRIILTVFAILMVVSLLVYSYYGIFVPTPPAPTPIPGPLI